MEAASLVLAVAGTLELCVNLGTQLVDLCREIRNLSKDIDKMAIIIEGIWLKTEVQVGVLKRIWGSASSLHPSLQAHYAEAIQSLYKKILGALKVLEKSNNQQLSASNPLKRARVLYLVRTLKWVVADLEKWQRKFDPSWYLITLLSASTVDEKLRDGGDNPSSTRLIQIRNAIRDVSEQRNEFIDSIFKSKDSVEKDRTIIPGTNTCISNYNASQVLLDRTNYGTNANFQTIKNNVRDLARMLMHVDPASFGLLKCVGAVEVQSYDSTQDSQTTQFEFILEIPDELRYPKTLRSLLLSNTNVSLTKRIQLSKQLARSVMFVHTTGFVHKGIRPETVLIFNDGVAEVGPSFLIGFERVRHALGQTDFMGDLEWEKNIYRHPVRQGQWTEEAYIMQHDIYSLGVCLLEIGLWHSFVQWEPGESHPHPWSELNIQDAIFDKDPRRGGFSTKEELVAISKERLPSLVGDRYTKLVLACLCCLDEGSEDNVFGASGSSVMDKDGIVVGVRYIENVLLKTEELLI
ncbi:uncharacterized protein N7479_010875 [Penicillium vulpinum]|uniref:Protein kinase domain-containing protein n=1 Tax=Penicillium vulpinum TaxID=29845 RepID=A0A1V6RZH0_9EURO|nr:uncharacterized protein N7479_010875 [Penicillium vulpinum]KAJ5952462.1 hypothetical protein N7479_010875 [Penicillium vulpinum]OQE07192.1 hypothetical protein PENVUL_c014G08118 [Penicillium vulpinum]